MRKLFFLFLLVGSHSLLMAQDTYYILAVKGKILNKKTKQYLKAKQKIKSNDKVIFKNKNAKALIYSRGKGRFNLSLSPKNKKSPNELVVLVKKSIFSQKNGAYARGTKIDDKAALVNLFGIDKSLVIVDKLELEFISQALPYITDNEDGFFFVRYTYESKVRNIALKLDGNKLILTKEALFKTKDGWVDQKKAKDMIFSYYKKEKKEILFLNGQKHLKFQPLFLSEEDMKENGMYNLAEYLQKVEKDEGKLIEELTRALTPLGTPEAGNVKAWYKRNFK